MTDWHGRTRNFAEYKYIKAVDLGLKDNLVTKNAFWSMLDNVLKAN